jgi:hypothetical protein
VRDLLKEQPRHGFERGRWEASWTPRSFSPSLGARTLAIVELGEIAGSERLAEVSCAGFIGSYGGGAWAGARARDRRLYIWSLSRRAWSRPSLRASHSKAGLEAIRAACSASRWLAERSEIAVDRARRTKSWRRCSVRLLWMSQGTKWGAPGSWAQALWVEACHGLVITEVTAWTIGRSGAGSLAVECVVMECAMPGLDLGR